MMKESFKDKLFRRTITVLLVIIAVIAVIPLMSTVAMSFSSSTAADMNAVTLWPVDFTLAPWKHILQDITLWRSCAITAVSTILTVFFSVLVTALMAYPLSKSYFKAGRILMIFVVLTMIFKAPVVPYFLTLKNLGFYNNPLVLVVPHIFSAYNMAIMRTSFKAFPGEIEEAAVIDGCGTAQVLFRIIFPSSKATLTTIGLFYAVTAWPAEADMGCKDENISKTDGQLSLCLYCAITDCQHCDLRGRCQEYGSYLYGIGNDL